MAEAAAAEERAAASVQAANEACDALEKDHKATIDALARNSVADLAAARAEAAAACAEASKVRVDLSTARAAAETRVAELTMRVKELEAAASQSSLDAAKCEKDEAVAAASSAATAEVARWRKTVEALEIDRDQLLAALATETAESHILTAASERRPQLEPCLNSDAHSHEEPELNAVAASDFLSLPLAAELIKKKSKRARLASIGRALISPFRRRLKA